MGASLHHEELSSIAVITKTVGSVQFIPVSFFASIVKPLLQMTETVLEKELFCYSLFIPTSFSLIFSHSSLTKLFGQEI